jgi:4'-phosphopantetheinyl transferase EntD
VAGAIDPLLRHAVTSLSQPGLLVDCRLIAPGDESALLPAEINSIASRLEAARRASGAARIVGRALMAQLGVAEAAIPKDASGAPLWPAGVIGSFAHDDTIAVASVGLAGVAASVGVDVEPAILLPPDVRDLVVTPREQARIGDDPCGGRLLFTIKEAVYKAVHPLDRTFLEYHDIEVDLAGRRAIVRNSRVVAFRAAVATHLVVLAVA